MEKDEVIQLWVSNGFIPPRGETSLYLLGGEIFTCLVWRSFFQVVKEKKYLDDTDSYKMHDLMHDMARYVMKDDILFVEPKKEVIVRDIVRDEVLHLSLSHPDFLFSPTIIKKLTSLRSIFVFGEMSEHHIRQIVTHVNLRVLYLRDTGITTLPELIYKLKHLKYLNLSHCSHIKVLPKSIVYLQNLQVLILSCCWHLSDLPKGLRYMRNLECLDIHGCSPCMHLPLGIKEVTKLRILPEFPVGNNSGAKIGELRKHNILEGTLAISGLKSVRGISEAKSANLKGKRNLLVLRLDWKNSYEGDKEREIHDEKVLEGLEPNPCLERLQILYYSGKIISPSWMVSLKNLIEIQLSECEKCEHIPLLGRLPNLRLIKLHTMASLKCFHDDDKGNTNMFPCLQELRVFRCHSLVSLPSYLQKLQVLDLEECDNLVSLPDGINNFTDLNKLQIHSCNHLYERYREETGIDWPKISHIPQIEINRLSRRELAAGRIRSRFLAWKERGNSWVLHIED